MVQKVRKGERTYKEKAIKIALYILLFCLGTSILFFEFFYDLKKEPLLMQITLTLDVLLIIIFLLVVIKKLYRKKNSIIAYLKEEKADIFYLILICSFLYLPRLSAGLIIFRLLVAIFMRGLETQWGNRILAGLNLRPSQTLALSFVGLIAVGTALLAFPASTTNGRGFPLIDALFTMTSAACVSGFSIVNIGTDFTRFGQAVILFGMQAGGLGIMVLSAAFAVFVGGAIPSRRQVGLRAVLDVSSPEGLKSLIRSVTKTTIMTEFVGAIVLFFLLGPYITSSGDRLWWAIFHSVAAFCNAGISLSQSSMMPFVNERAICLVILTLITIGGVGFFVISDLTDRDVWKVKKPRAIWSRLQIQTKVVLIATVILDSCGMLIFLFFEYDGALSGLSADSKIVASLFHSINLRSAGFQVISLEHLAAPTIIFSIAYMFIGASPGSTGGGIKTTTAFVSVMALRAMLRGREDVEIFGRRMPSSIVNRSLSMVLVAAAVIVVFLTLLLATQEIKFERLFFETVSAFGTVGLSMNTTNSLNGTGKILLIFVMYVGRIGPLTLALAIGERKLAQSFKLPKGRIAIG